MPVTFSDRTLRSYFSSLPDFIIFILPPTSVIFAMHFVLFGDQRLEGMVDFYDQIVPADNTLELIWSRGVARKFVLCFTNRCNLASVVTLPGQWHHLELVLVSEWLPTASWCERVVKVLSFLADLIIMIPNGS